MGLPWHHSAGPRDRILDASTGAFQMRGMDQVGFSPLIRRGTPDVSAMGWQLVNCRSAVGDCYRCPYSRASSHGDVQTNTDPRLSNRQTIQPRLRRFVRNALARVWAYVLAVLGSRYSSTSKNSCAILADATLKVYRRSTSVRIEEFRWL